MHKETYYVAAGLLTPPKHLHYLTLTHSLLEQTMCCLTHLHLHNTCTYTYTHPRTTHLHPRTTPTHRCPHNKYFEFRNTWDCHPNLKYLLPSVNIVIACAHCQCLRYSCNVHVSGGGVKASEAGTAIIEEDAGEVDDLLSTVSKLSLCPSTRSAVGVCSTISGGKGHPK